MAENVRARLIDYSVTSDGRTIVVSPSLARAIKDDKTAAVDLMKSVTPGIVAADVGLDSAGNVVIKNQAFANEITKKLNAATSLKEMEGTNTGCGLGC